MAADDGWEYWTRVYDDPTLRSKIEAHNQDGPSLSEVLSGERLRRTQLVFENVPRIPQRDVKQLLETHLGNARILHLKTSAHRWIVKFYRMEDAYSVLRRFDGLKFRGRFLVVRPDEPLPVKSDEPVDVNAMEPVPETTDIAYGRLGGQLSDLSVFDSRLHQLLESTGPLAMDDSRLKALCVEQSPGVRTALEQWPAGVFRTCSECRLVGRYVCRAQDDTVAWERCMCDNQPAVFRESWEPMAPCEVLDRTHLVNYAEALLRHFGPLWWLDTPLRLLSATLPDEWPRDTRALLLLVAHSSPTVVAIGHTFFLITDEKHRAALATIAGRSPT